VNQIMTRSAKIMMFVAAALATTLVTPGQAIQLGYSTPLVVVGDDRPAQDPVISASVVYKRPDAPGPLPRRWNIVTPSTVTGTSVSPGPALPAPVINTALPNMTAAGADPPPLKEKKIDLEFTRTPEQERETREHDKAIKEHKDEINTLMQELKKQQNSITGR
jgi:hypothetical protein